jgi:hypothetical protein
MEGIHSIEISRVGVNISEPIKCYEHDHPLCSFRNILKQFKPALIVNRGATSFVITPWKLIRMHISWEAHNAQYRN